jgi:hypothetical protein
LVSLKNAWVHFKPEWDDSFNKHQKLEAKLWLKDAEAVGYAMKRADKNTEFRRQNSE